MRRRKSMERVNTVNIYDDPLSTHVKQLHIGDDGSIDRILIFRIQDLASGQRINRKKAVVTASFKLLPPLISSNMSPYSLPSDYGRRDPKSWQIIYKLGGGEK